MAVNDILDIGQRGLSTNRTALQTTSNNIANANTPGYSRQKAQIVSQASNVINRVQIGSGAEVKQIVRVHDSFVQRQLVDEGQTLGQLRVKSENLGRFESLVTKEGEQLNESLNRFFNDFRELSTNPENSTLRNTVQQSGKTLAASFQQMNHSLEVSRHELDLRIGDTVTQINGLTKEIAALNEAIHVAQMHGQEPNELMDKREGFMRELSQKVDLQATENQLGQQTIVVSGTVLVQGNLSWNLDTLRTPAGPDKKSGSLSIFVKTEGRPRDITRGIKAGELGGMLQIRDKVVNPALKHLDRLALQVANSVNDVHRQGEGMDGVGQRNFFKVGPKTDFAAFGFDLDDAVKSSSEKIAVGFSRDLPGDNEIALKIADLQNEKLIPVTEMGQGVKQTLNESLTGLVADVGIQTRQENQSFGHQQAIVDQLENYRESYSGVNLEEEALDLIKYQTVFNASAKAMKVGEDLLTTILSLKD